MQALSGLSTLGHKIGFVFKQHGPEIAVISGMVGCVAAAVLTGVAVKKAEPIVEETKKELETLHEKRENAEENQDEVKKEIAKTYAKSAGRLTLTFAAPAIIMAGSLISIGKGTGALKTRFTEASAALALTAKKLDDVMNNIEEKYGEDAVKEIDDGYKPLVLEGTVEEDGKKKKKKFATKMSNKNAMSNELFRRVMDWTNKEYERYEMINDTMLNGRQNLSLEMLMGRRHLFIDSVDTLLGFGDHNLTKEQYVASRIGGWVYDKDNIKPVYTFETVYGIDDGMNDNYPIFNTRQEAESAVELMNLDGVVKPVYIIKYSAKENILEDLS